MVTDKRHRMTVHFGKLLMKLMPDLPNMKLNSNYRLYTKNGAIRMKSIAVNFWCFATHSHQLGTYSIVECI